MYFCPFIKAECDSDCVFRCRPCATSPSMMHETVPCIIASRIDALNVGQADQLSEIVDAVNQLA